MDAATTHPLTPVCAPAGFGKSAALAERVADADGHVAWLSLDAGNNDPARLWTYVAAALDPHLPAVAERIAALLRGAEQPAVDATASLVVVAAGSAERVVLVIEDYHVIDEP